MSKFDVSHDVTIQLVSNMSDTIMFRRGGREGDDEVDDDSEGAQNSNNTPKLSKKSFEDPAT